MRVGRLSPAGYQRVAGAALLALLAIVVTGAAVRLTGSGLGCDDWPTCYEGQFRPESEFHALVEFINRAITGLVSVFVIAAVLGSLVRRPRRRDLTWLSLGLVAGVVLQIVLGAITTLTELNPLVVGSHFLASALLVANATVLFYRSGCADELVSPARRPGDPGNADAAFFRRAASGLILGAAAVVVAGVVVTGAGPHGGDEHVERLSVAITDAVRVHSVLTWLFLAALLVIARRARQRDPSLLRPVEVLLVVVVCQGVIGYAQYFTDIPAGLVGLHVAGAMAVWTATVWLWCVVRGPARQPLAAPPLAAPSQSQSLSQ